MMRKQASQNQTPYGLQEQMVLKELVIFDFDGTLCDTRSKIVATMQKSMREMALPVVDEEDCASTIGVPLALAYRLLYPALTEAEAENCAATYRKIFERERESLLPPLFPHVAETLDLLKQRGVTMSLASSRTTASLLFFLERLSLSAYFSYVLGCEDVSQAKPAPEPVFKTMKALGTQAVNTMVVGDMAVDILMGRRAGVKAIGVSYGNGSTEDLLQAGAFLVIDDIADLPALL